MRTGFALFATLPVLALMASCGSNTETNTVVTANNSTVTEISTETDNGTANSVIATPAMTGQQFADAAAASDAFEVEAGRLAQAKGTTQAVKGFGAMMVSAHTDSTRMLNTAAGSASPAITPNAVLTPEQQANLDTLRSLSGVDFDAAYLGQQRTAHQKALAALQGYATAGEVPQLRTWAEQTIPVVKAHLDDLMGM